VTIYRAEQISVLLLLLVGLAVSGKTMAAESALKIFDGHIHYSIDVWDRLPPQRALALLTEAGITRALVSASPGEGAERLYRAAPERVVPFLRPYAKREHRYTWFKDATIIDYVKDQLARIPYRGIGEFHVFGEDARMPVVVEVVRLARERELALHAHTDVVGMQVLLSQAPDIPVIWAHGGFDVPESTLRALLAKHKYLYIELSFREGLTEDGQVTPVWRQLMTDFQTRFMVGMDTYTPLRWVELPSLAAETRDWLEQLPEEVARAIAYGNAARLFAVRNGR